MVIACLLAGWRSGLVALLVGQALTWRFILSLAPDTAADPQRTAGFAAAFIAQLIILLVLSLYQREVGKGTAEREKRLALLDEALREIDHRTRNNYQTVLAMVELQSRRATDANVSAALRQVADRIQAVANATNQLAAHSGEIGAVKLDDHLCELVDQIARGLSREEIDVECDIEDVTASADAATSISIIVNELVTNALKHAFNGEGSGHVLVSGKSGKGFELVVADDGHGMKAVQRKDHPGLGNKLVESFARQLGAEHKVTTSNEGTTHRLLIPSLND